MRLSLQGHSFLTVFWGSKSWHRDINIGMLHSEITVKLSQIMAKTWQKHGKNMAKTWQKTWVKHGKSARTWQKHGKNMAKTWQKHGKNMAKTWQKHGKNTVKYRKSQLSRANYTALAQKHQKSRHHDTVKQECACITDHI